MDSDPGPSGAVGPSGPLPALAAALQRFDPTARPLAALLAEHAEAARLLTDALLDAADVHAPPADADAVPASEDAPDAAPRLGSYRLLREVGRGGQAVVFEALDERLGRRVALKVLRAGAFGSSAAEGRFRAEALTTSRLDHPGICAVYEIGSDDDQLFLAMRYVDGATLAWHIAEARRRAAAGRPYELDFGAAAATATAEPGTRHGRPWLATLRVFEQAARALHAAHLVGITHRDFKPGNLMVQRDGTAVVLDFGMAADEQRDGATLTRSGEVFGTPAYMAPEQCRDSKRADARSDVFALGAALFEALTGEVAFDAPTPEAVIRRILAGRVPDPRRFAPNLPRELAVIVRKALDPDPARRYPTAAEFADDLVRFCQARPIHAEPPSLWLVSRRWVQRNPWLTAMLCVVAAGAAVVAVLQWRMLDRQQEVDHLTLRQELVELRAGYSALLPIPEHPAEARSFCDRARRLLARQAEVAARVAALRREALPPDPVVLARMRAEHPAQRALEGIAAIDAALSAGLGTAAALAAQRAAAPERARQAVALRRELAALRPWGFADAERQRLHDAMTALLGELTELGAEDGLLATVQRELTSLAGAGPTAWTTAIDSIARLPVYGGLRLRPQLGLQPLRQNAATGLWEFLHLRSGSPPRMRDDGGLAIDADTGIVLVLLPGGSILVGSQDADPSAPHYDKRLRPVDRFLLTVPLEPFFFAAHEVTQAQWQRLGGRNDSDLAVGAKAGPGVVTAVHPVENVWWRDAAELLARSGLVLPTDLQWEYVARACPRREQGSADADAWLEFENLYDQTAVAHHVNGWKPARPQADGFSHHAPVGSFRPNAFGAYDVLGNVMEWCIDFDTVPDRDLVRAGDGRWLAPESEKHMVRGGYFASSPDSPELPSLPSLRAAYSDRSKGTGVRAARALER